MTDKIINEGVARIARIEADIRWLLDQEKAMLKAGVTQSCLDTAGLHYRKSLAFAKRGRARLFVGLVEAGQRGPNDGCCQPD